jgi:cobalamin biosynthesis protein CobT
MSRVATASEISTAPSRRRTSRDLGREEGSESVVVLRYRKRKPWRTSAAMPRWRSRATGREYIAWTHDDRVVEVSTAFNCATSALHAQARSRVGFLRRRLATDLQGRGRLWVRNARRGKIDENKLYRVATDDDRVFRRRVVRETIDTAFSLLIDFSGSMAETRLELALVLGMAFSESCDLLGIPNEVLGFTTSGAEIDLPSHIAHRYTRRDPLCHLVIKPYERSFSASRHAFANAFDQVLPLCNVDGEALLWAARRLAERREAHQTLVVLSDGAPCCCRHPGLLARHLKETVKKNEDAGIQCVGIGIQSAAVKYFYRQHAVINRLDDLVSGGYEVVARLLRGARS